MSASRLKGKPLLEINNLPIICHVVKKAKETGIGKVIVATEDKEIVTTVKKNGGEAILTGDHKTGTDRIFEAFQKLKITDVEYVVNLQGDEPMIDPNDIINLNNLMIKNNSDIGTLASEIKENSVLNNENIVKVITKEKLDNNNFTKALNFSRKDLSKQDSNIYHHIGIYAYKVSVLEKFINFNQTKNEVENRLEQLRALDNNITIMVALAKSSPIGIDTKEDYLAIKKIMEYKS
jgi:3-deoxy-manno-octulosonate cytidylyltransferase (CMP-KDO synthetase)